MGTWGSSILKDDTVLDVIEEIKKDLKVTRSVEESTKNVIEKNTGIINDDDDGPLFWIALAKCQWDYGTLDEAILKQVIDDFNQERGLDRWREEYENELLERKQEISDFIQMISIPNLKIKKMPKQVIRKPLFETGDCIAIKLDDGYFGAAVVAKTSTKNPEYGKNLVLALDYYDVNEPGLDVFKNSKPMRLTYGKWGGIILKGWVTTYKIQKPNERVIKVGTIDVGHLSTLEDNGYPDIEFFLTAMNRQLTKQNTDN